MLEPPYSLKRQAIALAAIATAFPSLARAEAARVDFTLGPVSVQSTGGQTRALAKGATIDDGDTVITGPDGRAQLRFTDGAYVSLQPESQFRIDQYRFSGRSDGTERGFFSLLKGGLRTITGLVGRTNRKNYQVTTSVATIGIRGTEYTIQYGKSIHGTVGGGEIEVCNGSGCFPFTNGESYYVQAPDVRPQLTDKKVDLPPQQPSAPLPTYSISEDRREDGAPASIEGLPAAPGALQTVSARVVTAHQIVGAAGIGKDSYTGSMTVDTGTGQPTVFADVSSGNPLTPTTTASANYDGVLGWGRFTSPSFTGTGNYVGTSTGPMDYVFGAPATMPTSGTATYTLLSGTPGPTFSGTGGNQAGTISSVTFTANFGTSSGSIAFTLGVPAAYGGGTLTTSSTYSISGSDMIGFSAAVTGSPCGSGCSGSLTGFFAGANAIRAGVAYDLNINLGSGDKAVGVFALKTP